MSRPSRKLIKTSFFHVLVQGINHEFIFNTYEEMNKYRELIFQFKNDYNIKLFAYCIMNNHTHILIKVDKTEDMSLYMHKINTIYAMYYNKKHNREGYVFRDRFKSQGIFDEKYLYNCINYIHNNPVKAGICVKKENYPFSSYNKYLKLGNRQLEKEYIYDRFIDVESDENIISEIVTKYLENNNLIKKQLINNKTKLKELILILKNKNKMSFRKVEKEIGISRETLRKLIN